MTKSLANRLLLKQQLYSFKIGDEMKVTDQIDEFIKILDDLENIEVTLEDEDKALILLNALPKSYENFKDAMIFGREQALSLCEVQSARQSKELQRKLQGKGESLGESLIVRGRPEKRTHKGNKSRSRSKRQGKHRCFQCHKEGHWKKDSPEKKRKQPEKVHDNGEVTTVSDGYE